MNPGDSRAPHEWVKAFVALGSVSNESWVPQGAGVLVMDPPLIWLVTLRSVVESFDGRSCHAWVARKTDSCLIDLSQAQMNFELAWISHSRFDVAATLFPADPTFDIRAFSSKQCVHAADLPIMQQVFSVGCMYNSDIANPGYPVAAAFDGIVSLVDAANRSVYTTALMFPRNLGGPLLAAPQYGGAFSLAGIMTATVMLGEQDPRALPVRMSRALAMEAVWDLLRSEAAMAQRNRVLDAAARRGGDQ